MKQFEVSKAFASEMDSKDPLSKYRNEFHLPKDVEGKPATYFLGNSLGLQPKTTRVHLEKILRDWETWGVEAYTKAATPWITYGDSLHLSMAKIVGAKNPEVVLMNALSVNLHLMLVSFYRPTKHRFKVIIEEKAFPSDEYAIKSQLRFHHIDPADALLKATPERGATITLDDFKALFEETGDSVALILLGGVNYYSGQAFELREIANLGHEHGAMIGYDLAHAVGNIPLKLHDWKVDFAVWCTYKYLNGGPGGPGGCFVHESHFSEQVRPRFEGWWGNKLESRFLMESDIDASIGAAGWQISSFSPLLLAPLDASLKMFDEVSLQRLRKKSLQLTGYLEFLLDQIGANQFSILTPRDPNQRGCQLSIQTHHNGKVLFEHLTKAGIYCDWREPDVIRVAPVPFYNTFTEVFEFAEVLRAACGY
ncbi:MAG: kynureninase [Promethearchaeota archaeon]